MTDLIYSLHEGYWEDFYVQKADIEFLYNHLLETETPMTTGELVKALVSERIRIEKQELEKSRTSQGEIYQPKGKFQSNNTLVFPAMAWKPANVLGVREGQNPDIGEFQVIKVRFEDGLEKEFASNLANHILNQPPKISADLVTLDVNTVLNEHEESLAEALDEELSTSPDFVRIAGNWFPRALLIDTNIGHLNLVEAVLDVAGGGPLPTRELIEQIGLSSDVNQRLLEFSLDWALQNDPRFDEVGAAGKVLWFLHRLEPREVLEPPPFLRYAGIEYDRSVLTKEMLNLERELDDELSPLQGRSQGETVDVRLIYPHWRSGTLPLSSQVRHLFPTAYEAPRIRFILVDGDTGDRFPAWVVREKRYVFGLKEWYQARNLIPGSIVRVQRGKQAGEVMLKTDHRRASREWMRTVLVGSDGGVVFAMLKQNVACPFDDRWAIAVPDVDALDHVWSSREHQSLEKMLVSMTRELAKLNPQGHVHAAELYTAINIVRRVPPAPILALLASMPDMDHVGDLHFRLPASDYA